MEKLKFISGPPGTGKTSMFITQKYTELLKKYSYNRIIILSHTNVAADEIRSIKSVRYMRIVKAN